MYDYDVLPMYIASLFFAFVGLIFGLCSTLGIGGVGEEERKGRRVICFIGAMFILFGVGLAFHALLLR